MMEIILHIVDVALPIILGYFIWVLKEERNERKQERIELQATNLGMKEILGYMIDRWHEEFILQGYVTSDQYNTFMDVYKAYDANKGNGARKAKKEEVARIHVDDTQSSMSPYLKLLIEQREKECKSTK